MFNWPFVILLDWNANCTCQLSLPNNNLKRCIETVHHSLNINLALWSVVCGLHANIIGTQYLLCIQEQLHYHYFYCLPLFFLKKQFYLSQATLINDKWPKKLEEVRVGR
ncbi:hypothetical protein CsSME_00024914 [Camellia sinensis var. sinensis]